MVEAVPSRQEGDLVVLRTLVTVWPAGPHSLVQQTLSSTAAPSALEGAGVGVSGILPHKKSEKCAV